jgi:hypothetical protein
VDYRSDMLQSSVAPLPSAAQPSVDPLAHLPLTDYFGAVTPLQPSQHAYELQEKKTATKKVAAAKAKPSAAAVNAAAATRRQSRKQRTVALNDQRLPTLRMDPLAWWAIAAGTLGAILLTFLLDSACSSTKTKQRRD